MAEAVEQEGFPDVAWNGHMDRLGRLNLLSVVYTDRKKAMCVPKKLQKWKLEDVDREKELNVGMVRRKTWGFSHKIVEGVWDGTKVICLVDRRIYVSGDREKRNREDFKGEISISVLVIFNTAKLYHFRFKKNLFLWKLSKASLTSTGNHFMLWSMRYDYHYNYLSLYRYKCY